MRMPNFDSRKAKKSAAATRSLRIGGYSVAAIVIVLVIVILVNILAGALPVSMTKIDVTATQRYSLSEQTKTLVKNLSQEVTVYYLVQSGQEDATLEMLLDQYDGMSSKIRVIRKDPAASPTFLQKYSLESVEDNTLIVECGDRFRYLSSMDIYEYDFSSYYTTGSASVNFAGESALTSAIDYCISETLPKLYLLAGHGESTLSNTFAQAVTRENIETATLNLLNLEGVPEDASAVMIYAPQSDISATERDMLLEYLQNGGNLVLLTDPHDTGSLTNLEKVMAYYGITAQEGIVAEGNQSNCIWGNPLYLMPELIYHTITNPLRDNDYRVLLPVAHGLNVSEDLRETVNARKILVTSDSAYSKLAGYDMTTSEKETGDVEGKFGLAVAVEEALDDDLTTNIVWIGSSLLLDDDANMQVSGGNLDLFLNTLNWVCEQEENSYTIHAKSMAYEYLTLNGSTATTLTVLLVGMIPLAYLLSGIVVLIRRKRR